ncbi:MAG: GNAT family N-acetyltransferase, partial [Armatimonadota bacterium]
MLIRHTHEEDLEECGRIYAACFNVPPYEGAWSARSAAEMLAGLLARDPENCWCAVRERVIGFAFCTAFGTFRATVQEFAVEPGQQGRGLGTALLKYVLADFASKGI